MAMVGLIGIDREHEDCRTVLRRTDGCPAMMEHHPWRASAITTFYLILKNLVLRAVSENLLLCHNGDAFRVNYSELK